MYQIPEGTALVRVCYGVVMFSIGKGHGVRVPSKHLDDHLWTHAQRELKTHVRIECRYPTGGCCGTHRTRVLLLKEEEYSRLSTVLELMHHGENKANVTGGQMAQCALRLWPKHTFQQVALRTLAPHVMGLVYGTPNTEATVYEKLLDYAGLRDLHRTAYATVTFIKEGHKESADEIVVGADDLGRLEESAPHVSAPPGLELEGHGADHGGDSEEPEPAEDLQVPELGRTTHDPDNHVIWAEQDGKVVTKKGEASAARAALVLPTAEVRRIDANTPQNVLAAKAGRIDAKQNLPMIPSDLKSRIGAVVSAMLNGRKEGPREIKAVFSEKRVQDWLATHDLDRCKSGKWSPDRLAAAVQGLLREMNPQYEFRASIKAEPMPDGKPPRMLIADGDDGQVMALMVIKCIEDLTFSVYEGRSIKHAPKDDAMRRVIANVRQKPPRKARGRTVVLEGDGSAWDTTCTPPVRGLAENRIIMQVTRLMCRHCLLVPEMWHEEHEGTCLDASMEIKLPRGFNETVHEVRNMGTADLTAIRRSGHRGTSILNWLTNQICWLATTLKDGWRLVDPGSCKATALDGSVVWMRMAFEGDDSLVSLYGVEADYATTIEANWIKLGFNMKLFVREQEAEFCGWKILVDERGPTNKAMPDLRRALANSGCSCSPAAVVAARDGDHKTLKEIAMAKSLSYAYMFRRVVPSYSRKLLAYADSLAVSGLRIEGEDAYRVYGSTVAPEGNTSDDLRRSIEAGLATWEEEKELLESFNLLPDGDEMAAFEAYTWDYDCLKQFSSFEASLPLRWRRAG